MRFIVLQLNLHIGYTIKAEQRQTKAHIRDGCTVEIRSQISDNKNSLQLFVTVVHWPLVA